MCLLLRSVPLQCVRASCMHGDSGLLATRLAAFSTVLNGATSGSSSDSSSGSSSAGSSAGSSSTHTTSHSQDGGTNQKTSSRRRLTPDATDYFELATTDLDEVFGPKRAESSRIEASMRRIALQLFLGDKVQRALLEQEISEDERQFTQRYLSSSYLQGMLDRRDMAPRPEALTGKAFLNMVKDTVRAGRPSMMQELASLFWNYHVRERSKFYAAARELLKHGYKKEAQYMVESLLLSVRQYHEERDSPEDKPLDANMFALCLELAMANNEKDWFVNLSEVCDPNGRSPFKAKFGFDRRWRKIQLLLAEGFMKFGYADQLDAVLRDNKERAPEDSFYLELLAVSMELAARRADAVRAERTFDAFESHFDPLQKRSARFLLLAKRHPVTRDRADKLIARLSPALREFCRENQSSLEYVHEYAK